MERSTAIHRKSDRRWEGGAARRDCTRAFARIASHYISGKVGATREYCNYPTPMNRIHIAISTRDIATSVQDYSARLGIQPCVMIPGEYALWRTESLNVSVRQDSTCKPGQLRHLGWEDEAAETFTTDTDCNGILWERFAAHHQAAEINEIWPDTHYIPTELCYEQQ
ncbi:MAG: hypothetical protein ACFE0J_25820 [Elainellaceae cyanobacterium]